MNRSSLEFGLTLESTERNPHDVTSSRSDSNLGGPTLRDDRPRATSPRSVIVTVESGPDGPSTHEIARSTATVGRSEAADVRVADPKVSALHVELSADAHGIRVIDLGSSNGTTFEGARVRDVSVPPGARLRLGDTTLVVTVGARVSDEESAAHSFGALRGRTAAMRELFATLERLSRTNLSVLIEGATGTGKELAARGVHDASRRREAPFVVLDSTAVPPSLAESVMFGHERGAFTGAGDRRAGVFEAAAGGTVFIDEIGDLPTELQPKLLRVLERREVVRVGGTQPVPIDFRVVCATWRDLPRLVNHGDFREDLYYRIAQAHVRIPSLEERPDDVPLLVYHFLQQLPADVECARAIAPDALDALIHRGLPGNVRQLKSIIERAAVMAEGATITVADLAFERILASDRTRDRRASQAPAASDAIVPFKDAKRSLVDEFEKDYLRRLLQRAGGVIVRAAQLSGLDRHHIRDLLRKHELSSGDEG